MRLRLTNLVEQGRAVGIFLVVLTLSFEGAPAYSEPLKESRAFPAINELRVGLFHHTIETIPTADEDGTDINIEFVFGKLPWAQWSGHGPLTDVVLNARPHVGVKLNNAGDTNQFYFGLTAENWLTERIFFEVSFGGSIHDGPLDEPLVTSFGCPLLFREAISVGFAILESWRLLLTADHISNANLCDRNRGLSSAGVRLGYALD